MRRTRQAQPLASYRLAIFRSFRRPDMAEQSAGLRTFAAHRKLFLHRGDLRLGAAAERAWLQDALLTAASPARSRAEAQKKTEGIEDETDRWVLGFGTPGSVAYAAMIVVAITLERARWAIPSDGGRHTDSTLLDWNIS